MQNGQYIAALSEAVDFIISQTAFALPEREKLKETIILMHVYGFAARISSGLSAEDKQAIAALQKNLEEDRGTYIKNVENILVQKIGEQKIFETSLEQLELVVNMLVGDLAKVISPEKKQLIKRQVENIFEKYKSKPIHYPQEP